MLLELKRYGTSSLAINRVDGGQILTDTLQRIQKIPGVEYADRQYAGQGIVLVWGSPQSKEEEGQILETIRRLHEDLMSMGHEPILFNHCETVEEWLVS